MKSRILLLLAVLCLFYPCVLAGETITFDGTNTSILKNDPWGTNNSLWPSATSLSENTVTITGGTVNLVYGAGNAAGENIFSNTVNVQGGTVNYDVYGGASQNGNVYNNNVYFSLGNAYSAIGGWTVNGAAYGNSVIFSGGNIDYAVIGGYTNFGYSKNNKVNITGGTLGGDVYGGWSGNDQSPSDDAVNREDVLVSDNSVEISGTALVVNVFAGASKSGHVRGNKVSITGGTVNGDIYGGHSKYGNAENNSVLIAGGVLNSSIYGGYSENGSATGNTVTVSGNVDLNSVFLYGGSGASAGDYFTGNTLVIDSFKGTVRNVSNFENYNFYLGADVNAGGTVLNLRSGSDLSASSVFLKGINGASSLQTGDSVTLISNALNAPVNDLAQMQVNAGVSKIFNVELETVGNAVTAKILSSQANPQVKSLSEGQVSVVSFLNQGSDLVSGLAINSASVAALAAGGAVASFGTASAGSSRYNTGSYTDVSGFSLAAGAAKQFENVLASFFVEGGWGNYSSYNSFASIPTVEGNGSTNYYGLGLMGRYDFNGGIYTDASAKIGSSSADYNSSVLGASYKTKALYYGLHAGVGYIVSLMEKVKADLSAKYMFTRQNGDDVTVLGDKIEFSAANSQRIRTGGRGIYEAGKTLSPYLGVYLDYEFDGSAQATAAGNKVDAPSLKGSTWAGELGLSWVAGASITLDASISGYAGKREGFSGGAQIKYMF